jgi:hypothetical protein
MFFFFYFSANGFGRSKLQIKVTRLYVRSSPASLTDEASAIAIIQGLSSCFAATNRLICLRNEANFFKFDNSALLCHLIVNKNNVQQFLEASDNSDDCRPTRPSHFIITYKTQRHSLCQTHWKCPKVPHASRQLPANLSQSERHLQQGKSN